MGKGNNNNSNNIAPPTTQETTEISPETNEKEVKEVLLCLRPLRDGDNVGEDLRFDPVASKNKDKSKTISQLPMPSESTKTEGDAIMLTSPHKTSPTADVVTNVSDDVSSSVNSANSCQSANKNKRKKKASQLSPKGLPFKKRSATHENKALAVSRLLNETAALPGQQHNSVSLSTTDTEKSVVESLMLMCNKPKT